MYKELTETTYVICGYSLQHIACMFPPWNTAFIFLSLKIKTALWKDSDIRIILNYL